MEAPVREVARAQEPQSLESLLDPVNLGDEAAVPPVARMQKHRSRWTWAPSKPCMRFGWRA
ncbi:MAG: hypothetical protein HC853_01510 [Anaerolineae bacterium]|nr:hypothetical protein [Anaerolineae bacterium]